MKTRYILLILAALLALVFSIANKTVPLEQKLIRIYSTENLKTFPDIEQESIELHAALADMSTNPLLILRAKAALLKYRKISLELLPIYGSEPEFQEIFLKYGEAVLPAIKYFVANPVDSVEWMNTANKQFETIKSWFRNGVDSSPNKQKSTTSIQALTPSERGWYAISYIQTEGYDFIGQFTLDSEGEVKWLMTERVVEGLAQFFTSGIRQLETNYKKDEEIEASDIGWATLDVLVFASAVKVLRVSRNVAVSTRAASSGTRSAALAARAVAGGRIVLNSGRYAKWPLLLAGTYLVVTHPSLINDFLAELAEVIGLPAFLIQFCGWMIILAPLLFLVRSFLWFAMPFIKTGLWGFSLFLAKLSRRISV